MLQSNVMSARSSSSKKAPVKCWISDLRPQGSEQQVQILGTVVDRQGDDNISIDDGTGVVTLDCRGLTIKLREIGETVDCIALFDGDTLVADTIVWHVSPANETLRQCQLAIPRAPVLHKSDIRRFIQHSDGGISLEDLALLVDARHPNDILELVQDLQGEGVIYQNNKGEYMLL